MVYETISEPVNQLIRDISLLSQQQLLYTVAETIKKERTKNEGKRVTHVYERVC